MSFVRWQVEDVAIFFVVGGFCWTFGAAVCSGLLAGVSRFLSRGKAAQ